MEDREVLQGLQTNEQVFLVCGLIVYLPTYFCYEIETVNQNLRLINGLFRPFLAIFCQLHEYLSQN